MTYLWHPKTPFDPTLLRTIAVEWCPACNPYSVAVPKTGDEAADLENLKELLPNVSNTSDCL